VYDPSEFAGDQIVGIIETNSFNTKPRIALSKKVEEQREESKKNSTARTCW
jgi:hypothetical protein